MDNTSPLVPPQTDENNRADRNRLTAMFEHAAAGLSEISLEGKFLRVNNQLCRLLGRTHDELLRIGVPEVTHPDDIQKSLTLFKRVIETGESINIDKRYVRPDGGIVWANSQLMRFSDEQGQILGVLAVTIDLTPQRQSEEAFRKSQEHLSLAQEVGNLGSFEWNLKTNDLVTSPQLDVIYGTPKNFDNDYRLWLKCIHPDDLTMVEQLLDKVLTAGEGSGEFRIGSKGDNVRWLFSQMKVFYDAQGTPERMIGVDMDITRRKTAEEALHRHQEQLALAQRLESIGRLAGGVAHDFNNMLTAIIGYSDMTLRMLDEASPAHHNIEEIRKAGERSAQLTNQLLSFSRRQVTRPQPVCINQSIRETANLLNRLIGEDIKLVLDLRSESSTAQIDPGQLAQVIMNLVVNARDAMPEGGEIFIETACVEFSSEESNPLTISRSGHYVELTVRDTGTGIDEKISPYIFEPFFTTKEKDKGTGLGLSTVYGIVRQSNGYIQAESEPGTGTTFIIHLPLTDETKAFQSAPLRVEDFTKGEETVLLVEDEEVVRTLACQILKDRGYRVTIAEGGEQGLAAAKSLDCRIDLLVTDVVMPGMNGRDLAEKITEMCPDVKILYVSGYADDARLVQAVTTESLNFLQKPFTPGQLAQKVRAVLDT